MNRTSTESARAGRRPGHPVRLAAIPLTIAALLAAAACGSGTSPASTANQATSAALGDATPTKAGASVAAPVGAPPGPLPGEHVHGLTRGRDGQVKLATHDGLYTGTVSGWIKVSPSIDLMGFAVAADGTYLASGHPGPQAGLPSPAGLIRSTDGGTTWKHLSRGGQSDFHALGAGTGLIAAFDGKLRLSTNGTDWTEAKIPADPYSLAVNTAGDHLIATTGDGTFTSSDRGQSWQQGEGDLQPALAGFAGTTAAYGIAAAGALLASVDAGHTWTATGATAPSPMAFGLTGGTVPELLIATSGGVESSRDGGKSISPA